MKTIPIDYQEHCELGLLDEPSTTIDKLRRVIGIHDGEAIRYSRQVIYKEQKQYRCQHCNLQYPHIDLK